MRLGDEIVVPPLLRQRGGSVEGRQAAIRVVGQLPPCDGEQRLAERIRIIEAPCKVERLMSRAPCAGLVADPDEDEREVGVCHRELASRR